MGAWSEPVPSRAAGAVLREGTRVPAKSLIAGVPAHVRREVKAEELEMIRKSARQYIEYARTHRQQS